MFELVIIYIFTFSLIIIFSYLGVKVNNEEVAIEGVFRWNKFYFISFAILMLFIGTRDGVGVDFNTYKEYFENEDTMLKYGEAKEIGYIWLTDLLHFFNLNYHYFFLATSFITVFLLFKSFTNFYSLLPAGIFIFLVGGMYNFDVNGVRQGISMIAFFNALRFINWDGNTKDKIKNVGWFLFYIGIGVLFHYSILIFVPLIFILNNRFLNVFNSLILIAIVIFGFFLNSVSFLEKFTNFFIGLFPQYEVYADLDLMTETMGFHLGAVFILITNLIPLFFYNKIKSEFPQSRKYFVMYALGTGLMYAFSQYMVVARVILYLSLCNIFVFAFTFIYLRNIGKQKMSYKILNIFIISFYIILFIYSIPKFMEIQIENTDYSLWFIPLSK